MAQRPVGKIRSPLAIILLSIVTLGIYGIYYQYAVFREMKDYSGNGIGGGLAIVFALLISGIPNLFLMPAEVGNMYAAEGQPKPVSGPTGFWVLIPLAGAFIYLWKVQGALNRFWAAHGATA